MPGAYLYGWDAANSTWVKCLVNAEGKLIIDPTEIFENTPTDDEHGKAPDSDWAYDHDAKADAHHAKYTDAEAESAINNDADHGATAPHNYFSGDHADLSNVLASQHHAKTGDNEVYGLILSDTVANRPAAGIAERYFFATDEGIFYYDDGAAWSKAAVSDHADLDGITSDDHHAKYTDAEAQTAINNDVDHGATAPHNYFSGDHADLSNVLASQHHAKYTDAEAQTAINNDADHGSTAPHNYFSGSHDDLSDVSAADHHAKYTDAEVIAAIEAGNVDGVQFANHERGDYDIDGFLYWDLSAGLYIRSSNAPFWGSGGRLIWSGANVYEGEGISISYGGEDKPTISTTGEPGSVPSGSKMLFKQDSAPSGWTFVAEDNDRVILNTNTEADGGLTGGTWQLPNVNGHAISEAEMPSHNHGISVSIDSASANVENYGSTDKTGYDLGIMFSDGLNNAGWTTSYIQDTGHSHGASGSAGNTGGDSAHAHSQVNSWRPSYVKVITCSKD